MIRFRIVYLSALLILLPYPLPLQAMNDLIPLIDTVKQRLHDYRIENGLAPDAVVPVDAVTASGSGLDPHISVKNALLQAPRVARARGLAEKTVFKQIELHTEGRDLRFLGDSRVNVLMLNVALDKQ